MELWKILLFLTGLASVNLASACMKKRVKSPSRFPLKEVIGLRIKKGMRPILHSLFNLDIAPEKFVCHLTSMEKYTGVVTHLKNLSPEEVATLQKTLQKKIEVYMDGKIINDRGVNNAIRKLLDSIIKHTIGKELKEWYFIGQVFPTLEKGSFVLHISAEPRELQSLNRFYGLGNLILVYTEPLGYNGLSYNSIGFE